MKPRQHQTAGAGIPLRRAARSTVVEEPWWKMRGLLNFCRPAKLNRAAARVRELRRRGLIAGPSAGGDAHEPPR
jgi:hypothetical protein